MPTDFGPEDRELLESAASEIYEAAVGSGWLALGDKRFHQDERSARALALLLELGLLRPADSGQHYLPVDPSVVQSRVVAPMGQQAAELLNESSQWAETFANLGHAYRRSPNAHTPVTEIHGVANINRFLVTTVDDAREELLTAQPTLGRSSGSLEAAAKRDIRAVERGLSMRTLYQHSARRSIAIQRYVKQVTEHGAQIRTLEEFFNRMIVVDRTVAIVPGATGNDVAIAIHEPSLVAYLVDVFERYWERARAFEHRDAKTVRHIRDDVRQMSIRMLVEGHSDPASAKRLGVSTRTYAGYIAALKADYDAQTRFQLGYAMGQFDAAQGRRSPKID